MKQNLVNKTTRVLLGIGVFSLALFSCQTPNAPGDGKYLVDFHKEYFEAAQHPLAENKLALYVDYSTCIAKGLESDFFQALVPSMSKAAKKYYSIKGDQIEPEEGDVYTLLRNIQEVNYANLQKAAQRIVGGNTEAVLLTDGEYYKQSIAKSNVNNPYLTSAFKEWLTKGHDIYILAEPYIESNKGTIYNKKRFYFLFTDNRLMGNIYDQLVSNVKLADYPQISMFHLSAEHPRLMAKADASTPNPNFGCRATGYGTFEIQDWQIDWSSIQELIMNGVDETTGEPLPYGEPIISGLSLDRNSFGGLRISDVEVKVASINTPYFNYYNDKEAGGKPTAESIGLSSIAYAPNFIMFDKKEFEAHGNLNIYLDKEYFDSTILDGNPYNYFKIDVCIRSVVNNFNDNASVASFFEFDSIDLPGQKNVSIGESIKLCLSDPDILKMIGGQVIYSIYVKSNQF